MNIKKTKKVDVRFGHKEVFQDNDFEPSKIGHRISIVLPEDVLMQFRKMAKDLGTKYQTLINQVLREAAFSEQTRTLEQRLNKLEKIVFKK